MELHLHINFAETVFLVANDSEMKDLIFLQISFLDDKTISVQLKSQTGLIRRIGYVPHTMWHLKCWPIGKQCSSISGIPKS